MKNRILLLLLSIALSGTTMAQITIRIGTHEGVGSWKPATPSYKSSFSNAAEGQNIAQQIIDIVGLRPNFEVREANVPNAAAVVYGGKRYVLYNPNFIRQLETTTGTKWAGISVLAHEIGHHLNGHTITGSGSQPALELESDEFSGFVLRKMGASLAQAQAAMKTLASVHASKTHPGQYQRLTAIADGWEKADAQMEGRTYVAKQRTPAVQQPQATASTQRRAAGNTGRTTISSRDLIASVKFNADPRSDYYITSAYNLVRIKNNQLASIGKLAKTSNSNYPYIIYDRSNTQVLVDRFGNLLTKQGKRVGKMSVR